MAISLASIQGLLLPGLEKAMCGSKGSTPVRYTMSEAAQLAQYQRLVQQQPNLYQGYAPNPVPQTSVPQVTAKELTKEELKERIARKLDLAEAEATTAVEVLNHARWRQIMDEVFKDDDKGDDHAKRTEAGSNGGRKRGNGTGGDDAG